MAFTVKDFEDLVRIIEEHPEWRSRMRQIVLTQDLLELPNLVRRLAEAAAAHARTLRQVSVDATPTVIGEKRATPDTQALAQQEGVEWMVGGGLLKGFLEFRQTKEEEITRA